MKKIKVEHLKELQKTQEEINNLKREIEKVQRKKYDVDELIEYCRNEFSKVQLIAYPLSCLEREYITLKSGKTKCYFTLRDYVEKDGKEVELFSIIFEMKPQVKIGNQKNDKFLKKLDQDRKKKM